MDPPYCRPTLVACIQCTNGRYLAILRDVEWLYLPLIGLRFWYLGMFQNYLQQVLTTVVGMSFISWLFVIQFYVCFIFQINSLVFYFYILVASI